jgi:hypothetical protein
VAEARGSVAGKVRLMARYIDKAGLAAAVRRRDWETFARGYNGPQYRRDGYHRKIAAAYHRFRAEGGEPLPVPENRHPAVRIVRTSVAKAIAEKTAAARVPAADAHPARTDSVQPTRRPLWSGLAARLSGIFGRS